MLVQKITRHLKKRKVKLFLVFLLVSSLAWFINKLSESYTSIATFKISYVNVPEEYILKFASKENVEVKLQASGFQFLGFKLRKKMVSVDVSESDRVGSEYILSQEKLEKQIEKQLPNSMFLKDLDKEAIFFELDKIATRRVPVVADLNISYHKNCILDGKVEVQPEFIEITGPLSEIDTIARIKTNSLVLKSVSEDFYKKTNLIKNEALKSTTYSNSEVIVKGAVSRFSEKMIEGIPVTLVNLPKNIKVKTFPNKVKVLCKAKLGVLKKLTQESFTIIADYNAMKKGNEKVLLKIGAMPNDVYSALLPEKKITYIISQE